MKTMNRFAVGTVTVAILLGLGLSACGNMSTREKDVTIGAAAGAVTGNVISGGSTAGTVGGAIVGGVIGDQVGKDKR